jgi:hypothetical protein
MPTANRVHLVMALEAGNSGGRSTLVAAMYGRSRESYAWRAVPADFA